MLNYVPLTTMQDLMKPMSPSPDSGQKYPRLYIQGIPVNTAEFEIEELFGKIGKVCFVSIVPAKKEDQRTTYGFVSYISFNDAQLAVDTFDEYQFHFNTLKVAFSKETSKQFGLEMDEDDEDDYYDKLYDDIEFSSPEKSKESEVANNNININVNDLAVKFSKTNGIHESNGAVERHSCPDAVRGMMFTDLPVKPFPDDMVFNIYPTEIVSPKSFYGQLVTSDTVTCLQELSDQLNEYKSYEKFMTPFSPKINELCVAKFKEDEEWYRAFVLSYIDDSTAEVFFVDYGNKSDVNIENIRCINERLLNFPRYAMNFAIDGIKEETPPMVNTMKTLLLNKPTTVTCVSIEGNTMISDVDSDSGVRLITALTASPMANEAEMKGALTANLVADTPEKKTMLVDLQPQMINSSSELETFVVSVNSASDISVWIGDLISIRTHVELFTSILYEKITATCGNFTPVVGEVCAGFNEQYQEWYRIHIVEVQPGEKVKAKLIDYGNHDVFKTHHLASLLPDELFSLPAQASTISLSGVPLECGDDETMLHTLRELVELKPVICTVDKFTDRYVVKKMVTCDGVDVFSMIAKNLNKNDDFRSTGYTRYKLSDIPKCHIDADTFHIVVTSVEGPSLFYGQFADAEVINATARLSQDLAVHVNELPSGFKPNVGDVYAGLHKSYGEWYRVLVNEMHDDSAKVLLIDYGEQADILLSDVRPLPSKCTSFPVQGIAFSLHDYSKLSKVSENLFIETVQLKRVQVERVSCTDGVSQVRLYSDGETVDFVTKSSNKGDTLKAPENEGDTLKAHTYPTGTNSYAIDAYTELPAIVVPDQCAVMFTHVKSPLLIYGQVFNETTAEKDFELKVEMNEYCSKNNSPHRPNLNEVCCALFEEDWCRVNVVDLKKDSAAVFFIDYGNHVDLTFDKLRTCPKKFLTIPALSIPFQLNNGNLLTDSEESILLLKEKLENEMSVVTVTSRSDEILTVDVEGFDIAKFAKKEDLDGDDGDDGELSERAKLELSIRSFEDDGDNNEKINARGCSEMDADSLDNSFISVHINESQASDNDKYVLSSLPRDIHPLEAAEMKMDISVLSTKVANLLVTQVISPSLIYGVTTDEDVRSKLETMEKELNEALATDSIETFKLKAGVLCAAKDFDAKWLRTVVTDVNDECCSVFCIDTGKTLTMVSHDSVRPLDKRFKLPPAQATPFKLITVRPLNGLKTWSSEAIDFFRGMIDGEVVRALPKSRDGIVGCVKLKLDTNDVLVDKLFEASGYAEKFTPVIIQDVRVDDSSVSEKKSVPFDLVTKAIAMEQAPEAESFQGIITCVVSPRLFYARIYDDVKLSRVDNMSEALTSLYGHHPVNDVTLNSGDLCAVLYTDNQFYRGFIIEMESEQRYLVWLIDYGIRGHFSPKELWPLPEDMQSFPAQAFTMQLHHILPKKTGKLYAQVAIKKFKSLIIDKVMRIDIKYSTKYINRVTISEPNSGVDIGDILVRSGFAKYYVGKEPNHPNCSNYNEKTPYNNAYQNISPKKNSPKKKGKKMKENLENVFTNGYVPDYREMTDYNEIPDHRKMKNRNSYRSVPDYREMTNYNEIPDYREMQNRNSYKGAHAEHRFPRDLENAGPCQKCSSCNCHTRVKDEYFYNGGRQTYYGDKSYHHQQQKPFYYDEDHHGEYNGEYTGGYYNDQSPSSHSHTPSSHPHKASFTPNKSSYRFFEGGYPDKKKGDTKQTNADQYLRDRVNLLNKKQKKIKKQQVLPSGFNTCILPNGELSNISQSLEANEIFCGRGRGFKQERGNAKGRGLGRGY